MPFLYILGRTRLGSACPAQSQTYGRPFARSGCWHAAPLGSSAVNLHDPRGLLPSSSVYPSGAGVASWLRTVRLDRGKSIQILDAFQLKQATAAIVQTLMTPCDVSQIKPGQIQLIDPETNTGVLVEHDPGQLTAELETIELDDEILMKMWGPRLHRILLQAKSPLVKGGWKLQIVQCR